MPPQLPPEIVAKVISYLSNRSADLRTCALVCKSWAPWAQSHIFSALRLLTYNRSKECIDILQSSPHIVSMVNEIVTISCAPNTPISFATIASNFSFTHVRKLALKEIGYPLNISGIAVILAHLPMLEDIKIAGFFVPRPFPALLAALGALTYLKKLNLTFSESNSQRTIAMSNMPAVASRCQLASLSVSMNGQARTLVQANSLLDISQLKFLEVDGAEGLHCLLPHIQSSIETLRIATLGWSLRSIENMINGRFVLPNLRNIYTSFSAECLYLLLHSFSAENMEHIDLVDFSIAVDTDLVLLPYNTSLSFRWTSLDAKLDGIVSLKKVLIRTRALADDPHPTRIHRIQALLPMLARRDILQFELR